MDIAFSVSYYGSQLQPLLWCTISVLGAIAFYKTRTIGVLLMTIGVSLISITSMLNAVFPYSKSLNIEGQVIEETAGLIPFTFLILSGNLGLLLVLIGGSFLVFRERT